MITPAISVLSAVEGLEVVQPSLDNVVVPIAAAILIGLFALQRRGTGTVGRLFGPVMLIWFVVLAALGCTGSRATRAFCRRCPRRMAPGSLPTMG